jgi:hypothetical protein
VLSGPELKSPVGLPISESMAERITFRLGKVAADFSDSQVVAIARRTQALPLLLDTGGLYGLRPSGEVVSVSWDSDQEPEIEEDRRTIDIALAQGAKRYPELSALLPNRSPDAPTCPMCGGDGVPLSVANNPALRGGIGCWCGGLGWIPESWGTVPAWVSGR